MEKRNYILIAFLLLMITMVSCRKDEYVYPSDKVQVQNPNYDSRLRGVYLLNEGNMGMNRASIDYLDYRTGVFTQNIYSERNPDIVKELGDVGNDIAIYGNKLYAVINLSNYIEVMDAKTAKHIKGISVPNCRYLAFNKGRIYVSSYAGKVAIDPNAEIGFVAEIDTATLKLTRKVEVGYQPEEMVVVNDKLYVANSGGYRVPNYDYTVSVIDLKSFTKIKTIDVGINLHRMVADSRGDIYVSSRGDYYDVASCLYVIDSAADEVKQKIDIPVSNMYLQGDSLYFFSVAYSHKTQKNTISYGILNTKTKQKITDNFITDGTEKNIMIPYGLAVNPYTNDIYITDAQNYVVSGYLYAFSAKGVFKWRVKAGNIPACFAFLK